MSERSWSAALLLLSGVGLLTRLGQGRRRRLNGPLPQGWDKAMLLLDAVESDDQHTGMHSRTVLTLAAEVTTRLGVGPDTRRRVELGALLHDAGKIRVPNEIIHKAGPLHAGELQIIRRHTIEGQRLVEGMGRPLSDVGVIVRGSHERWDGNGYPDGLAGAEIPLESRIVACCDAFSAMTTDRSYRPAMPISAALEEVRRHAGSQFDPGVARTLVDVVQDLGKARP